MRPVAGVPADRRFGEPHIFHMAGEKYLDAVAAAGAPSVTSLTKRPTR